MTRRPSPLARVLSSALAAGTLLTTAACSDDGDRDGSRASGITATQVAGKQQTPSPTATLTTDGARAALITEADIEEDWSQVKDTEAENWHDSLFIGTVDVSDFLTAKAQAADCQRLLDSSSTTICWAGRRDHPRCAASRRATHACCTRSPPMTGPTRRAP